MCSPSRTHLRSRRKAVARSLAATVSVLACAGCTACSSAATPTSSPSPSVAIGVIMVVVPDVVGRRADDARARLTSSGFEVGWSQNPDPPAVWEVVSQQPAGGRTAAPNSVVQLDVAAAPVGSSTPSADRLTTPLGLTFDVAAAVCDAQGRNTSPGGWAVVFDIADARREGASLLLHATLPVLRSDGRSELREVECTVAGSDITPVLQFFWVH